MSSLDVYFRNHGHYPRKRIENGERDQLTVSVASGYAEIRSRLHNRSIYIPHSAWRELLRFGIKTEKYMGEDHDVEQAMHEAIKFEDDLNREMRQFKKTLYRPKRRRRRHAGS